uniref:Uncharacterized protein n=1 Tax=Sphaerodactylus townsendi TaxID=933632 RepID=A0ACB8E5L2_9SAUR
MKIRSPKPVAGSPFKNPYEALMKCDDGTTVGLGQNHLIRDCQWERLDSLFNSTFRQFLDLKDELEIKEEKLSQGMFHFHGPGRTLPIGTENRTEPDAPVALSVHWSTSHHLCFYLLSRPPKEKTGKTNSDPKPDIVWPCAAPVVLSAVTPCFSHLALVCEDGAITVWDKSLGFALFVTVLPEGYVVRSIQFMPLSSKTVSHSKDSATRKVQLLVLCTDGSLHLLTSETKEFSTKVLVYKPEHPSQAISAMATVPSLTNAVLTCSWDGTVSLDRHSDGSDCVPLHHASSLQSPLGTLFSLWIATPPILLILQGYEPSGSIKAESGSDQNTIFLFDVTPCPETFSQPDECPPDTLEHLPWDRRCDVFLKNSYQQLSTISQQIPESWSLLKMYAATLQGMGHEK